MANVEESAELVRAKTSCDPGGGTSADPVGSTAIAISVATLCAADDGESALSASLICLAMPAPFCRSKRPKVDDP
eukprot:CAMPEP_0170622218 /NCGR_PEP_ID=MMETSP0224-20130122/29010_1 /TAXON_ID=285029 /ORGANISM="Togula jolla, Strain CCCM 725" /LENGTH=74 /DNA_ID=CAMNT_0010948515 /DNA_START=361 /DNA_END=585 /DNA_ORIENTATION=-